MEKTRQKRKAGTILIWRRVGKNEQISPLELQILTNREIPGLLRVEHSETLLGRRLTARCAQLISLEEWLQKPAAFRDFLSVAEQAVRTFRSCQAYGLNTGNIVPELKHMFVQPGSLALRLLYWPLERIQDYTDESQLFLRMGRAFHPRRGEEKYRLQYLELFRSRAVFDIHRFAQQLQEMSALLQQEGDGAGSTHPPGGPYCLIRRATGEQVIIRHFPFSVGRDAGNCDLAVKNNSRISARHFLLRYEEDSVFLVDTGSTNRTRLNGKVIPQNVGIPISSGCVIEIGAEQFLFQHLSHSHLRKP